MAIVQVFSSFVENTNSFQIFNPDLSCNICILVGPTSGTIMHYFGTFNYENNQDKTWDVYSGCEDGIVIRTEIFQTEDRYDYVTITDGNGETTQYSGLLLPFDIVILTNHFYIYFYSDESVTQYGFQFIWQCSSNTTIPTGKNKILKLTY